MARGSHSAHLTLLQQHCDLQRTSGFYTEGLVCIVTQVYTHHTCIGEKLEWFSKLWPNYIYCANIHTCFLSFCRSNIKCREHTLTRILQRGRAINTGATNCIMKVLPVLTTRFLLATETIPGTNFGSEGYLVFVGLPTFLTSHYI